MSMRKHKGFSLIEITVALGIIISAILVFGVFAGAARLRKTSEFNSIASRIATETIERLKAAQFSQISASGTFPSADLLNLPQGRAFYRTSDFQGNVNIKQIDVTVEWILNGMIKTLKRSSIIASDD